MRRLTVCFDSDRTAHVRAISNLNLSIGAHAGLGIVGESGSGKTTTALAILGLLPRSASVTGSITFDGSELLNLPERAMRGIRGARISMVRQEPVMALHPLRRVGAQVGDVLDAHSSQAGRARDRRVEELLKSVGLGSLSHRYPHELSGGQRQRVLIAQAIACHPRLVILDEPFTALDDATKEELIELLRTLRQRHDLTYAFITHDPHVLTGLVDEVAEVVNGEVLQHTTTEVFLARVRRSAVAGRKRRTAPGRVREELLRVESLSRHHTGRRGEVVSAVDNVSFSLAQGGTLGIVGRSGAGKSTLARCLAGLDAPTSGQIWLKNRELVSLRGLDRRAARRQVQLVFQDPAAAFNPRFTIEEIISEPLTIAEPLSSVQRRAHAAMWLDRVGLSAEYTQRSASDLSGGQRQRVALARAMAASPDVLILDEAFGGLDLQARDELLALLDTLREEMSFSMIVISHDVALVQAMCDEIAVMDNGSMVERAPVSSWAVA